MQTRLPTSEASFQSAVVDLATTCGWLVHHAQKTRNYRGRWATFQQGHPGFPDLVLVRDGVVIFWELKSATGRVSPEQRRWHVQIAKNSNVTMETISPGDWGYIERMLRR